MKQRRQTFASRMNVKENKMPSSSLVYRLSIFLTIGITFSTSIAAEKVLHVYGHRHLSFDLYRNQRGLLAFLSQFSYSNCSHERKTRIPFSLAQPQIVTERTEQRQLYHIINAQKNSNSYQRQKDYPRNGDRSTISIGDIQQCRNTFELGQILRNHSNLLSFNNAYEALTERIRDLEPTMTPRDISALLHSLARLRAYNIGTRKRCHDAMSIVLNRAMSQMKANKFYSRDISMLVNALAKTRLRHGQLFDAAATRSIMIIDTFNALELASTVNAFAKTNNRHPELFAKVASESIAIIDTFNAMELANTANAFAKTNNRQPELFDNIATAAIPIIHTFNAQGLANTVNAFAKINNRNQELFDNIATAAIDIIGTFKAQELANTVNAFARTNNRNQELFDNVATAAIIIINTFNAQELASTANAFARTNNPHPELFDTIATAAIPMINTFNAQSLANIVNAFAKTNNNNEKLFDSVATAAIAIIDTFNAQELANTVNAFAKTNNCNQELFDHVATAAIPIIKTFNAQNLANTANAFTKTNNPHPELFDNIATAAIPVISTFNAQGLANTVNAFAKTNNPHPELFDHVATAAIAIIDTFNAQELANTVNAFSKIRMQGNNRNNTERLFTKIAQVFTRIDASSFSDRGLIQFGYAFLKFGYVDKDMKNVIGNTLSKKSDIDVDAQYLGNLAACFSNYEVSSSRKVLKIVCDKFQSLSTEQINLQCVADVLGAMGLAQQLQVASPSMIKLVAELAISKSSESRSVDVKDILLGLSDIELPDDLRQKLLITYKPFFDQYYEDLSIPNRLKILEMYEQ